jgi:hypothetical protein
MMGNGYALGRGDPYSGTTVTSGASANKDSRQLTSVKCGKRLGKGLKNHGVMAPVANELGIVEATTAGPKCNAGIRCAGLDGK